MNRLFASVFGAGLLFSVLATSIVVVNSPVATAQVQLRGSVTSVQRQANRLYQIGKWEEAEKVYAAAVKQAPSNSAHQASLSLIQAELFKLDAAEASAQKALKLNPKNPYAHIAQGVVYRNRTASSNMVWRSQSSQLLEKAIAEFETALRLDPNNPDAHNRLGEVYREQGRLAEAEDAFEEAVRLDPKFSEATANLGTMAKAKGNTDEAIRLYRKAVTLNTKNYKAHYYLGEALADKGDYNGAYNALNTALYQNRNSEMIYTKRGEVLEKQGNEAGAVAAYREAIRVKPEYLPAYQHLANLFDRRGDGEFAIAELKSAVNANPNLDSLKLDIARMSLAVDKPEEAIRYYNEVLSKNPTNPDALNGIAQAYSASADKEAGRGIMGGADKYVDAEMAINKALQANPNDLNLHLAAVRIGKLSGKPNLAEEHLRWMTQQPVQTEAQYMAKGEALFALGKYQESDAIFMDMVSHNRQNPGKLLALADGLKMNGDLDMAEKAYQAVLQSEPANLKAQRGLQRIDAQKGKSEKSVNLAKALNSNFNSSKRESAKDFYEEAVSVHPRQPEVRKELGKIYKREDNYAKAIFEYEAYLSLSPNLPERERKSMMNTINELRQKLASQNPAYNPNAASPPPAGY